MQPFGDRSKVVIEPMLTDQWFVDAKTLAAPALKAVQDGTTKLIPGNADKVYFNWLNDIQPGVFPASSGGAIRSLSGTMKMARNTARIPRKRPLQWQAARR